MPVQVAVRESSSQLVAQCVAFDRQTTNGVRYHTVSLLYPPRVYAYIYWCININSYALTVYGSLFNLLQVVGTRYCCFSCWSILRSPESGVLGVLVLYWSMSYLRVDYGMTFDVRGQ